MLEPLLYLLFIHLLNALLVIVSIELVLVINDVESWLMHCVQARVCTT